MIDKLTIMWGLPGSGKTHFVRENYLNSVFRKIYTAETPYNSNVILALDYKVEFKDSRYNMIPVENATFGRDMTFQGRHRYFDTVVRSQEMMIINPGRVFDVVVDTPCCSYKYFKSLAEMLALLMLHTDSVVIEAFREDRKTCKDNDIGRRSVDSKFSIENMDFDFPEADKLREILVSKLGDKVPSIKVHEHTTKSKDIWKSVMGNYIMGSQSQDEFFNSSILKSASYSMGGTLYGIGGEQLHSIEAEPMDEFTELDDLLEKLCPTLSFILYRQIKSELVKVVEQDESDYYSRCTSAHYEIDLSELYNFLKDNGVFMQSSEYKTNSSDSDEFDWEIIERQSSRL